VKLIAPSPGTNLAALNHEYTPKALLTKVEAAFGQVLLTLSGDRIHMVCKPRLADFIQHDSADGFAAFNPISQKHVDFLFCRKTDWMPMLAVELDDSSHNLAHRRKRDAFVNNLMAHLGIPLLRVELREMHELEALVKKLSEAWDTRWRHLIHSGSANTAG
jgi:hypothetical protein